jgi:two-component system phosphate regulon response regulator PhoB
MLTARKDEVDRIVSLELGADDYVTKPFSPRELTLRVKSILSRRTGPAPVVRNASVGEITFDLDGHEVKVKDKRVDLTAAEFKLLAALFRHPGRVFSRDELVGIVWGAETEIEIRTVDTHLRRLRDKLGSAAEHIQTVRGFGYRLDA